MCVHSGLQTDPLLSQTPFRISIFVARLVHLAGARRNCKFYTNLVQGSPISVSGAQPQRPSAGAEWRAGTSQSLAAPKAPGLLIMVDGEFDVGNYPRKVALLLVDPKSLGRLRRIFSIDKTVTRVIFWIDKTVCESRSRQLWATWLDLLNFPTDATIRG